MIIKKWCAYCGKVGDHTSGTCNELSAAEGKTTIYVTQYLRPAGKTQRQKIVCTLSEQQSNMLQIALREGCDFTYEALNNGGAAITLVHAAGDVAVQLESIDTNDHDVCVRGVVGILNRLPTLEALYECLDPLLDDYLQSVD